MGIVSGKVAFITGGASGIGKAIALRLAEEGATIGIADVPDQAKEAEEVVSQITAAGGDAIYIKCDVSKAADVEGAIAATMERTGRLDAVFANAGINGMWAPIEDLQPHEWAATLDINLTGTYLTVHYAIPHLRKAGGGSIVIVSSVNGTRSFSTAGATAYSTSKAGQVAFMKMAALELARDNIRVNAICPGAIHTNISERTQQRNTDMIETKIEFPSGKPGINHGEGEPEDVADVCLFLASSMSRHVSGVEIFVDGGASLFR